LKTAELQNLADFQKAKDVLIANGFGGALCNATFTFLIKKTYFACYFAQLMPT
jgi:hypothetical protein